MKALFFALLALASTASANTMNVFIIAGQSNAVGQGNVASLPADYTSFKTAYIYNEGDGIVQLSTATCLGQGHGIELSFVYEMQSVLGEPICIVKVAQNGSSMADPNPAGPFGTWSPFAGDLFSTLVEQTQLAMSLLQGLGHTPVLQGMVWWQGESDAHTSGVAHEQYLARTQVFMDALRAELNVPGMPICFIRCGLNIGGWAGTFPYMAQIRQAQESLGSLGNNCWVNVDDLYYGDIHPPSASLVEAGIRAAQVLYENGFTVLPLDITEDMTHSLRPVGQYVVIDIQGRRVATGSFAGRSIGDIRQKLLSSDMPPGEYFVRSASMTSRVSIPSK